MRLDLASFNVNRITLANETRLSDGELRVDAGAVKDLVLSEDLFEDVQVHAVHPGDNLVVNNDGIYSIFNFVYVSICKA